MKPIFIVSPPRSRGSVLGRMLEAGGLKVAGESGEMLGRLRKVVDWIEEPGWREYGAGVLGGWGDVLRLQWLGREGMREALDWWSWLLETWPDGRIVFVARDQGEVELSMMATRGQWVPKWGKCTTEVGARVKGMLDAMEQFHWLNPTRTAWVDAEVLVKDREALNVALAGLGMAVPLEIWEKVCGEVIGSRKELVGPADPNDPFHPLATVAALEGLPGAERPREVDPFASDATEVDLEALPGATRPPVVLPAVAEERKLRLTVPRRWKAVPAGKLAVYTLRWGSKEWMVPCVKSLEGWTERHGYALQVWGEPEAGLPNAKFACLEMVRDFLAGGATHMLYLDADVLIHPGAPGWEERPGMRVAVDTCTRAKFWDDRARWMRRHYPRLRPEGHVYRNAGVWSCDREAAKRFLKEAESHAGWIAGCMEQHQFNVFWQRAAEVGMRLETLGEEWNCMVHNRPETAAWFYHLAGGETHKAGYLERLYARGLYPRPVKAFEVIEPLTEGAICVPWISRPAAWEELRFALRSWEKHFADKTCPIYVLGDCPPPWLREGGRVRFLRMDGYAESWEAGMHEARVRGYQIARRVLWTNDDIYLLREQSWEDFEVALTEGTLQQRAVGDLASGNTWRRLLGAGTATLMHHGFRRVWRFATHTPVLYEVEKVREIFERYPVGYKGQFANYYHNHHGTKRRRCGGDKVMALPAVPGARFLNHGGAMPGPEIVRGLMEMFPEAAAWEDPAVPVADPHAVKAARLCVASCGEDLEWLQGVAMPVAIYDATGDSTEYIPVPNKGREAGMYLRHIVANYGAFAEYEIFAQGNPFDHSPGFLELLKEEPWKGQRACGLAPIITRQHQVNTPRALAFAKGIGVEYDQDVPWPQGAIFAASREALMSRPRKWWLMVLGKVEADQFAPWSMERLWLAIFDTRGMA